MQKPFQAFLYSFYESPKGRSFLNKEKTLLDHALNKVFGYRLAQIGITSRKTLLSKSRVQFKLVADEQPLSYSQVPFVQAEIDYLPFALDSMDAILLPHTLEAVDDPYHLLRQVDKILVGEGHLIISGFNPFGCSIIRHKFGRNRKAFQSAHMMKVSRVVDWLNLLEYDIEWVAYSRKDCLNRSQNDSEYSVARANGWLSKVGIELGDVYCILAKKRVESPTPVGLNWKLSNWLPSKKGLVVASNRQAKRKIHEKS